MLGGQAEYDVGDLMKDSESLSRLLVIPIHDNEVLASELRRLTGFVIIKIIDDLDLRVGGDGQTFYIDRNASNAGLPDELPGLENSSKLFHSPNIFVEQPS